MVTDSLDRMASLGCRANCRDPAPDKMPLPVPLACLVHVSLSGLKESKCTYAMNAL